MTGGGAIPIPTRPSLPLSSFPPIRHSHLTRHSPPSRHSERSEESLTPPPPKKHSTLGGYWSRAYGVSADGRVVVGWAWNASRQQRAFRWENGVMQDLGTLGGSTSEASGVSADGRVVVGLAYNASGQLRAFRWENGVMQDLGTLGGSTSEASGVSADGRVVVGWARNASGRDRAFRWENGVMQDLGTLGGDWSYASGVSADGRVVVGWTNELAFRWVQGQGMEDLNQTYASLLTDGFYLRTADAISPDGRYIVGHGYNASTGRWEAFLLDTVPEPASLMVLGAGLVGLLVRRRRS